MLHLVKNKNIFLEKVGNKQWKFVYSKPLDSLMKEFEAACDIMDDGDYDVAIEKFREIIKEEPYFIDAYNDLGLSLSWSGFEKEAQQIFEEGIKKVLLLFPEKFFEDHHRLEWGWLDNRSFLRCYTNLGLSYFENNQYSKAQSLFENLLMMNPNDNQGIRDPLLNCYFRLKNLDAAYDLCNQYQEDALVGISYGRVLVLFKLGNKDEAERQLIAAMRYSPRVAKEIVKSKHIKPKDYGMGPGIVVGSHEEAYEYWLYFGDLWKVTPGAILFIKNCIEKSKKDKSYLADDEEQ